MKVSSYQIQGSFFSKNRIFLYAKTTTKTLAGSGIVSFSNSLKYSHERSGVTNSINGAISAVTNLIPLGYMAPIDVNTIQFEYICIFHFIKVLHYSNLMCV